MNIEPVYDFGQMVVIKIAGIKAQVVEYTVSPSAEVSYNCAFWEDKNYQIRNFGAMELEPYEEPSNGFKPK